MRQKLARGADRAVLGWQKGPSQGGLDRLGGQASGPQQAGRTKAQNRRFDPHAAGPAIDHRGDAARQPRQHMRRPRRADPARPVGRGRRHRPAEGRQQALRHRMGGHAHRDRGQPRRDQRTQPVPCRQRQHQRQRPRPERRRERPRIGVENRDPFCRRKVGHMHDKRVELGPPLGRIDRRHRRALPRIRAKAIDRFRRKGDEMTLAQKRRRLGQIVRSGAKDQGRLCVHLPCRFPVTRRFGCAPCAPGSFMERNIPS